MLIFSGLVLFVVTFAVNFLGRGSPPAARRRGDSMSTDTQTTRPFDRASIPLTSPQLPAAAPWLAGLIGFGLATLGAILTGCAWCPC